MPSAIWQAERLEEREQGSLRSLGTSVGRVTHPSKKRSIHVYVAFRLSAQTTVER
ncbi:MAG: hypothetical protein ABI895_23245 [Deltaproteobacteria bacterium]